MTVRSAPKSEARKRDPLDAGESSRRALARIASTTLARWTRQLVEEAAPADERERILAELYPVHDAHDGDAHMYYHDTVALWTRLPAAHSDADFGLHFAERVQLAHLGIVGYFASTAATFGEALGRVLRFDRLLKSPNETSITCAPDAIRIIELPPPGEAPFPRHLAEAILATYLVLGRRWTGCSFSATAVRFQHAAPADTRAHEQIFGCQPVFGAPLNELVMPGGAARLPLRTADSALGRYLEPIAVARLAARPAADRLLTDLEREVLAALPDGYPSLQKVARKLGLSARSLQRRLEERSTRYQDVVDSVRHDAAVRLLADGAMSVAEVAFLLGFSDTSGFHRAFRRWTGRAPRDAAAALA